MASNGSRERVLKSLNERKRFCTSGAEVAVISLRPPQKHSLLSAIYISRTEARGIYRCRLRRDFQRLNSPFISTSRFLLLFSVHKRRRFLDHHLYVLSSNIRFHGRSFFSLKKKKKGLNFFLSNLFFLFLNNKKISSLLISFK